jgi:hypothetical protein
MKLLRVAIILPLVATTNMIAAGVASDVPVGAYEGGGRACSGRLAITAKTLSWRTPFSRCGPVSYDYVSLGNDGSVVAYVFHLKHSQKGCLYRSVELHRKTAPDGVTTWEAIGYLTREDQEARRLDKALACPLIH